MELHLQLDVGSVKWLEDYLASHVNISCLIVSHDSGCVTCSIFYEWSVDLSQCSYSFLDNVTTDIIHYEDKKVSNGRLSLYADFDNFMFCSLFITLATSPTSSSTSRLPNRITHSPQHPSNFRSLHQVVSWVSGQIRVLS